MIFTRRQFKRKLDNIGIKLSNRHSAVWIPEQQISGRVSQWFLEIKPVQECENSYFWEDCKNNLLGPARCYASGDNYEWWGFTSKDDAMWFMLRWAQ